MIGAGAVLSGRFELRRNLGVEGEATLWEAFDVTLDRRVLIKLLRADLATRPDAVDRFHRDMRAAARNNAPSAGARVLDAGNDATTGMPFMVFEWVEPPEPQPAATPPAPARQAPTPRREYPRVTPRRGRTDPRLQSLVLVLVLVPLAVGVLVIRKFLDQPSAVVVAPAFSLTASPVVATSGQAATPAARPTPQAPQAPAVQAATPVPAAAPTGSAQPTIRPAPGSGERRRVANTDGQGVALRATPGGDKLPGKGYDEGVTVTLLDVQGMWAHIRGDDGREGWVLAVTLVP